jgi:hypothetical protein
MSEIQNRYFCVGSEDEFHKCLKEAASEETAKERRRTAYRMNIGDNSTMTDVEDRRGRKHDK